MTKTKAKMLYQRLVRFAQRDHHTGEMHFSRVTPAQPWTAADLIDQDALYTLQQEIFEILHAFAKELDGGKEDGATVKHLAAAFPWAFTMEGT